MIYFNLNYIIKKMAPKVPDGEMKLTELKRLAKKYNDLMGIDLKGITRETLIKEIVKVGYTIDHKNKELVRKGSKNDKKKRPVKIKMPDKPEKKDKAEKKEKIKLKKEDVIEFILKNKDILKDDRISKLHKGVV